MGVEFSKMNKQITRFLDHDEESGLVRMEDLGADLKFEKWNKY